MSQVYSTEPQTAGRVIFETTHGPLEINLWGRECPATTRYFLQLCLDGYYEDVLFHRIVPNFLIQAGFLRYNPASLKNKKVAQVTSLDQSGNLKGFESYRRRLQAHETLDRRTYELNNRIRFNHRGQVAMALGVESQGMGEEEMALMQPQFFITLDEAPELDGKHVCFGTVTGPTIFNALRIANTDVDEQTNQPTILEEAPRIVRVKILENPIHTSIVPSPGVMPWIVSSKGEDADGQKKKKKKRNGVKNLNVLSFGDEMEQELDGEAGIKSSHDVIETKRFSKQVDKTLEEVIFRNDDNLVEPSISKECMLSDEPEESAHSPDRLPTADHASDSKAATPEPSVAYKSPPQRRIPEPEPAAKKTEDVSMPPREKPPKVSLVEARRAKYAKRGQKDKRQREVDTMAKFMAFQNKVATKQVETKSGGGKDEDIAARMAKRSEKGGKEEEEAGLHQQAVSYHGQVLENDDEAKSDWLKTRFKCRKHQDLDAKLGGDGRNAMEDYEVVDEKDRGTHDRKEHKQHHSKKRQKHSRT